MSDLFSRFAAWAYARTHPPRPFGEVELLVTLWTEFDHFEQFSQDGRLDGIRINPAMITPTELERALREVTIPGGPVPFWYDVKGRQLRIEEAVSVDDDHYEVVLNHPIDLDITDESARKVLFKAASDSGSIDRIEDSGRRLVLRRGAEFGPHWKLKAGESLHIKHPSLVIHGPLFSDIEVGKIQTALAAGFDRFFLSYVEEQADIDALREIIGQGKEIRLKIESPRGLDFVRHRFRKEDGLILTAARGDLFVEVPTPGRITSAMRDIIAADPESCAASRIMLSTVQRPMPMHEKEAALREIYKRAKWNTPQMEAVSDLILDVFFDPIPSAADLSEIAWLLDLGYRSFMLCDELCLAEDILDHAVGEFRDYEQTYREHDYPRLVAR